MYYKMVHIPGGIPRLDPHRTSLVHHEITSVPQFGSLPIHVSVISCIVMMVQGKTFTVKLYVKSNTYIMCSLRSSFHVILLTPSPQIKLILPSRSWPTNLQVLYFTVTCLRSKQLISNITSTQETQVLAEMCITFSLDGMVLQSYRITL